MRALCSEIQIDTPPQQVWQVLTDFDAYPEWNPFIRSIQGAPEVGSRLRVRIQPPGARGITLRPTVRALEPGRELRWLGHLLIPGLADGEHRLALEPLDGGRSRLLQSVATASSGRRPHSRPGVSRIAISSRRMGCGRSSRWMASGWPGSARPLSAATRGSSRRCSCRPTIRAVGSAKLWLRAGEPIAYSYVDGQGLVETALASGLRLTRPPGLLLLSGGINPPQALAISGYWLL